MEMGKRKVGIILLLFLLMCLQPLVQSAPAPFTVYGYTERADIPVTVTDARTGDSLTTRTDGTGLYQVNLGNMKDPWFRGDQMSVNASSASENFIIPPEGYIFRQDVFAPGSVRYLSNTIEAIVTVVEPP